MTRTAQVLAFILCCHTATAATLFVSPKGNDTNSGLGPGEGLGTEDYPGGRRPTPPRRHPAAARRRVS